MGEERCCTEESWDAAPLSLRGLFELFCDPGAALPGVLPGEPLLLSGERGDDMLVQFGFQYTKAKDGEENYQWLRIYEEIITTTSTVLRTELSIFSCSLRLAGQIDCLCRDRHGRLVIWDWKRSKAIRMDSPQQMKYPLCHLADCNYFCYALQLNVYSTGWSASATGSLRGVLSLRGLGVGSC